MKSKYLKIVAYILYSLSFLIFGYYVYQEFSSSFMVPTLFKLIYTLGSCIYLFFGSLILSKAYKSKKSKIKKISTIILFIEYIFLLLILTLLAPSYGRDINNIFNSSKSYIKEYINVHSNLIPFKTIINFIIYGNLRSIIVNIFGNLIAFMPLGLFIPLIFKKIDNISKFIVFTVIFVIIIEILQLILLTGSLDIDDLILNVSGAVIIYLLQRKRK